MITVQAVYTHGVLKPSRQLDLPEGTSVELQIAAISKTPTASGGNFADLAGIWGHLSDEDVERMEKSLVYT